MYNKPTEVEDDVAHVPCNPISSERKQFSHSNMHLIKFNHQDDNSWTKNVHGGNKVDFYIIFFGDFYLWNTTVKSNKYELNVLFPAIIVTCCAPDVARVGQPCIAGTFSSTYTTSWL